MYIYLNTYPNPFNPSCKIDIKLEQDLFVKISVTDVVGHEIVLLTNKVLTSGSHQFFWDARNFPNGIYFIKVKSNKSAKTKKITLLK